MKRTGWPALGLALALAAVPSGALGAEGAGVGDDEVTLVDGGMIRGTVVVLEPGRQVVIEVGSQGEQRTIPWAQVADVERGKHRRAPAPVVDNQTSSAPDLLLPGPGVVRVHIDSPEPVGLYEQFSTSLGQTSGRLQIVGYGSLLCTSPCDRLIDGRDERKFTIQSDEVPRSDAFTFTGRGGDVTVKVDPGEDGTLLAGQLIIAPGIAAAFVGGILLTIGISNDSSGTLPVGGVVFGAGAGVILTGVALIVAGSTEVEITPEPTTARAKPRAPRLWRGEF